MLCGEVLSGLESALRVLKFDVGKEFDVLTVSFDPSETPEMASEKKAEYLKRTDAPGSRGLAFPDRPAASIDALTKAAGFQYQYDPKTGQFAHATAIMVLTPEGKIAQYYYGVEFAPKDLRLGLIQASKTRLAPWWIKYYCTATTTIPTPENTERSSAEFCNWPPARQY